MPAGEISSRTIPGEGSFPIGTGLEDREDGGSQIDKVSDGIQLSFKTGRSFGPDLGVETHGFLSVDIGHSVTSHHDALIRRQSIDYRRAAMGLDMMDRVNETKTR